MRRVWHAILEKASKGDSAAVDDAVVDVSSGASVDASATSGQDAEAANTPLGTLHVRSWQEEETLFIRFEDDGCGIPPELQERIFEPFFTTKAQGAGLGLSIAFGIAQAHQGTLHVSSNPQGTHITLQLPLRPPTQPPRAKT